ncbi:MAG TPA: UDP-N-acetylmuramoyl-tripeptide--D-alanyl-D-alanine ligase [Thermoanaerobaculia bacterium]
MADFLSLVISFLGVAGLVAKRLLTYLRYFQQEEYSASRLRLWLTAKRIFDRKGSLVALAAGAICLLAPKGLLIATCLVGASLLAFIALSESDPRKAGKIRLNMTARARRIYAAALGLSVLSTAAGAGLALLAGGARAPGLFWFLAILVIQATPLYLMLGNALLLPDETRRQRRFAEEAKELLRSVAPFVVGITGSYGKTSTKAVLGEMLRGLGPTLWPPASINSLMGVTRYIRENLKPHHKYAVFEMGAYGIGSIRKLCDLVGPRAGIITNIGVMHLERFGSQDVIFRAKSELADAIPPGGALVLNGDDERCRRVAAEHPDRRIVFYGLDSEDLDVSARDVRISEAGTAFLIRWHGREFKAQTELVGRPALYNILAAFAMACTLGADPEFLVAVVRNLKPAKNRLEISRDGEVVFLNDAYNSNPIGFRSALEVLGALPASRRILVTPGMIELGDRQEEENRLAGARAAAVCDIVFVVGETNRNALLSGLQGASEKVEVNTFDSRDSALSQLKSIVKSGDVVLLENDLPDLYEGLPRL